MAIPRTYRKVRAERGFAPASPCVHAAKKKHPILNGRPYQAVPKPTQVGGYKHTKARGRNLVKELGNMAP